MNLIRNISYSLKNKLVILLAILFLYLIYNRGIKLTVEVINECKSLDYELNYSNNSELGFLEMKSGLEQLNKYVGDLNSKFWIQNDLVEFFNDQKDLNLSINQIFTQEVEKREGLEILTNSIEIRSDYKSIVLLCNRIEKEVELGKVSSVAIYKNRRGESYTDGPWVYCTIIIQSIHKNEK